MNAERVETDISEDDFADYLYDVYGDVEICGMPYDAGHTLREIDPIAFTQALLNYESELNEDNPQWECGECGEVYDNEDEADECCMVECLSCGELHDEIGEDKCEDCRNKTDE